MREHSKLVVVLGSVSEQSRLGLDRICVIDPNRPTHKACRQSGRLIGLYGLVGLTKTVMDE
jgi:hypothetical protein